MIGIIQRQQGLTLLELLIAISIFAVLSALAYGGLNSVLQTSAITEAEAKALVKLQRAVFFLERDLMQLSKRKRRTPYGEHEAAFQSANFEKLLEFSRSGNPNPAEQLRSNLQRVRYVLDEAVLYRLSWNRVDYADSTPPQKVALLDNIQQLEFRFLNGQKKWVEDWQSTTDKDSQTTLPLAVEFILEQKQGRKIRRVILTSN